MCCMRNPSGPALLLRATCVHAQEGGQPAQGLHHVHGRQARHGEAQRCAVDGFMSLGCVLCWLGCLCTCGGMGEQPALPSKRHVRRAMSCLMAARLRCSLVVALWVCGVLGRALPLAPACAARSGLTGLRTRSGEHARRRLVLPPKRCCVVASARRPPARRKRNRNRSAAWTAAYHLHMHARSHAHTRSQGVAREVVGGAVQARGQGGLRRGQARTAA